MDELSGSSSRIKAGVGIPERETHMIPFWLGGKGFCSLSTGGLGQWRSMVELLSGAKWDPNSGGKRKGGVLRKKISWEFGKRRGVYLVIHAVYVIKGVYVLREGLEGRSRVGIIASVSPWVGQENLDLRGLMKDVSSMCVQVKLREGLSLF